MAYPLPPYPPFAPRIPEDEIGKILFHMDDHLNEIEKDTGNIRSSNNDLKSEIIALRSDIQDQTTAVYYCAYSLMLILGVLLFRVAVIGLKSRNLIG